MAFMVQVQPYEMPVGATYVNADHIVSLVRNDAGGVTELTMIDGRMTRITDLPDALATKINNVRFPPTAPPAKGATAAVTT